MTREKEITKRLFEISTSNFNNSVVDSSAYFAGYIDGAKWADGHPHWISVEDELPPTSDKDDESDDYLIVDSDGDKNVGYYNKMDELWFSCDGYILDVTHWMPLPQAPLVTDLNKKDLPPVSRQEGNILVKKKGGEECHGLI